MRAFFVPGPATFRALLLTVLAGSFVLAAPAQPVAGLPDLHFGASQADVRTQLLARDGISLDARHTTDTLLVCDGGTFADVPVSFWLMGFVADRLHTVRAVVEPAEEDVLATYQALVAHFTARYGAPAEHVAAFEEPYEAGDGFETYAIRFGKGHFAAIWTFDDGGHDNVLALSIDEDLYIPIVVQSGRLIEEALAAQHPSPTTSGR